MIAYSFNTDTGEYIGYRELRKNPLNPDEYLARNEDNETLTAPPAPGEHETVVWDGKAWSVVADYRGKEYWDIKTKERHQISELGVKPEESWTDKSPVSELGVKPEESWTDKSPEQLTTWDGSEWVFDADTYREMMIQRVSSECFSRREQQFPQYKLQNLLLWQQLGQKSEYTDQFTIAGYAKLVEAYRQLYYETEKALGKGTDKDSIDKIYKSIVWPEA
jgi:hypothetical protein